MSDWDESEIDYLYPHKTPFRLQFENDLIIVLKDIDHPDAAAIYSSCDWVIYSLQKARGILRKKVFFDDVQEGLVQLQHDGKEFTKLIYTSPEQAAFITSLPWKADPV